MQEFKQISEMTSAKHVLYLVDVCYGGIMTLGTRSLAKNDFSDDEKYLTKITTEPARQIITAGGKGDKAQERAIWGHSAFTKELLSGIEDGLADSDQEGYITSNELGAYLSKKVYIISEENQTPVKGRYGSGEGEFVFVNPAYVEEIVSDKIDDVLSSYPVNIIDNSQVERAYSEIQNTLNFMLRGQSDEKSSISDFDQQDKYLDSTFVGPFTKNLLEETMGNNDAHNKFGVEYNVPAVSPGLAKVSPSFFEIIKKITYDINYRTPFVLMNIIAQHQNYYTMYESSKNQVQELWTLRMAEICKTNNDIGVKTMVFVQPMLGSGNKQISTAGLSTEILVSSGYTDVQMHDTLDILNKLSGSLNELEDVCDETGDLRMIFDNVDQPIFFDYIHTNDLGSEIIAEEIYEILINHI